MRGNSNFHTGPAATKFTTRVVSFCAASLAVLRVVTALEYAVSAVATASLAESTSFMKSVNFATLIALSGGE